METTLGLSPLLVQVETSTATCSAIGTRQLFNSSSQLCGHTTTTKGPTGQTTSHPTQMETTLGHSPLLVQVETRTATCSAISTRQLSNSSSQLCGHTTTTKGPTGQTTSHPTQMETIRNYVQINI